MENTNNGMPASKTGLVQKAIVAVAVAVAPVLSFAAEGDVDISAGVTVLAGAVGVIALVGAAKIVPNATIQVWGYVKQAFNRT
jgi:hypothetical protein